jgi:hypothetical protein
VVIGPHFCAFCRYWAVPEHPGCPDKVMLMQFPLLSECPCGSAFRHLGLQFSRQALTARGPRWTKCHRLAKSSCNTTSFFSSWIYLIQYGFVLIYYCLGVSISIAGRWIRRYLTSRCAWLRLEPRRRWARACHRATRRATRELRGIGCLLSWAFSPLLQTGSGEIQ